VLLDDNGFFLFSFDFQRNHPRLLASPVISAFSEWGDCSPFISYWPKTTFAFMEFFFFFLRMHKLKP